MSNSLTNEIRVKLHITGTSECNVKNLWICLNYDQKPTIAHVIEHIKKNYCVDSIKKLDKGNDYDELVDVKLFMDDYWLPPYENSRLIRENDCIK
jgi:hypothetical protein